MLTCVDKTSSTSFGTNRMRKYTDGRNLSHVAFKVYDKDFECWVDVLIPWDKVFTYIRMGHLHSISALIWKNGMAPTKAKCEVSHPSGKLRILEASTSNLVLEELDWVPTVLEVDKESAKVIPLHVTHS